MAFYSRDDHSRGWKVLIGAVVLVVIGVLAYPVVSPYMGLLYHPEELRLFVEGFGQLAPFVFVGLMALQVLIAPLPGAVFGVVGGILFGTILGTIVLMVGAAIGTIAAIFIAKRFGRPVVEYFVDEELMERFDNFSVEYGLIPFGLFMLLPGFPDDALCFIAGLTDLDFKKLVLYGTVLRLPGMAALAATGDSLVVLGAEWFIVLGLVLLMLGIVAFSKRQWIIDYSRQQQE